MTNNDTYNGWTNRETWALNLWLSNDQGLSEMVSEHVREALDAREFESDYGTPAYYAGGAVKAFWEELTDPDEGLMTTEEILRMVRDIGSEYRVNWDEIGESWISDLDDNSAS